MPVDDYISSGTLSLTFRMPPKQIHDDELSNDTKTNPALNNNTNGSAPVLILLSAQCIGHLGFALSLLVIWFGWLLPTSLTVQAAPELVEVKPPRQLTKSPRRPTHAPIHATATPTPLPMPTRRVSAPIDLTPPVPILSTGFEDLNVTSRHVYFADQPFAPIVRRNTMPEHSKVPCVGKKCIHQLCSAASSQPPSPPPVPANEPHASPCECLDDTLPDSDSSRHSSRTSLLRPSSRLQKLKLGFNTKPRAESADKSGDHASLASTETASSDKSSRRASGGGFASAWSLTRNRTSLDTSAEPTPQAIRNLPCPFGHRASPVRSNTSPGPSTTSGDILSPSFRSRKAQKRISAPIPRTSPYDAPYFATPPILLDNNYPAYLKHLPQFEDELKPPPSPTTDSDSEVTRGRSHGIRRVSLNTPPRAIHKQRSMSMDFTR